MIVSILAWLAGSRSRRPGTASPQSMLFGGLNHGGSSRAAKCQRPSSCAMRSNRLTESNNLSLLMRRGVGRVRSNNIYQFLLSSCKVGYS